MVARRMWMRLAIKPIAMRREKTKNSFYMQVIGPVYDVYAAGHSIVA
jgi:hypothetical protein